MAKKKATPKHTNRVSPTVDDDNGVRFDTLKIGECFLMGGCLYMHESSYEKHDSDQSAVNLVTGVFSDDLCGCIVTPVTITIAWKKK